MNEKIGKILQDINGNKFRCSNKKIGRGTFAEVFLGHWLNPPTGPTGPPASPIKVAIKQFYLSKQTLQRTLTTEINIMRDMDHPNIVKMIAVITGKDDDDATTDSKLWVIMELCEGGDFRSFLKDPVNDEKQRRLSEKWARKYMEQIANGLRYLRSKQIIHRDLKPHNLLMTKDRQTIKIADFGFARILGSDALEATMCGTPLYMSPQVLRGEQYSSKADLWSVGVILYEMLCGVKPFRDVNDIVALTQKVSNEPIRFPKSVQITRECRKLLVELLKKDEKQRIEWENFFNHEWFTISITSAVTIIPKSTPIPIPAPASASSPNTRIITNYMDQFNHAVSAPALQQHHPIQLVSSMSINQSDQSFFTTTATTPYGGSEPQLFGPDSSDSGSQQPVNGQPKISRSISNIFSTGFGLLKDSFQTGL